MRGIVGLQIIADIIQMLLNERDVINMIENIKLFGVLVNSVDYFNYALAPTKMSDFGKFIIWYLSSFAAFVCNIISFFL
jgi:hypothetical protein